MYRSIIFVTAFHFYHGVPIELADETLAGSLSVGLVTATSCASFLRCNIMEDILPWSSPLFVNWLLSNLVVQSTLTKSEYYHAIDLTWSLTFCTNIVKTEL